MPVRIPGRNGPSTRVECPVDRTGNGRRTQPAQAAVDRESMSPSSRGDLHPLRVVHVLEHVDDGAALCGVTNSRTASMLRPGERLERDERICERCAGPLRKIAAGPYVRARRS